MTARSPCKHTQSVKRPRHHKQQMTYQAWNEFGPGWNDPAAPPTRKPAQAAPSLLLSGKTSVAETLPPMEGRALCRTASPLFGRAAVYANAIDPLGWGVHDAGSKVWKLCPAHSKVVAGAGRGQSAQGGMVTQFVMPASLLDVCPHKQSVRECLSI